MALMLSSLYDALLEGGTSKEKATKAAEEVAHYEASIHDIRSDLRVIKRISGTTLAIVLSLAIKSFF